MKCAHSPCRTNKINEFKPITHVIFDLDGVILDTEDVYKKAFQKTLEDYGHQFENEMYRLVSGTTSADVAKTTINTLGLDVSTEHFIKKYRDYSKIGLVEADLLPGVERLIKHLYKNGVPMAIATCSARASFEVKTVHYGELTGMFHHVVCGDDSDVKKGKPNPDVYLVCASRFISNPKPIECLVFEDSANGMYAAIAAGMQVVIIPNESCTENLWKLATLKIDSFYDFRPEIFGLPSFRASKNNL